MVGAGLAGIFLAAGVTFASLALSKRSSGTLVINFRSQMTCSEDVLLSD